MERAFDAASPPPAHAGTKGLPAASRCVRLRGRTQIIFDLNLFWLREVEKKYPGDIGKLNRMSLVEEGHPQQVRMANLAVVGSHRVNGVAEIHSGLVKELFPDFVEFLGKDHFGNVTNGVTPRRWLLQCNPRLAKLITDTLGSQDWLKDLYLLKGLEKHARDPPFQKQFAAIKEANKARLAECVYVALSEASDGR